MDLNKRAMKINSNFKKVKKKVWDHARNETILILDNEQKIKHSSSYIDPTNQSGL